MRDFPELSNDEAMEIEGLIQAIRERSKVERELIAIVGQHPGVVAWLCDSGVLHRDAEHAETQAPLQEGLVRWLADLKEREARFADAPAFWSWFRSQIRRTRSEISASVINENRVLRSGVHELARRTTKNDEAGSTQGFPQSTEPVDHRSHRSSQLLLRDEMKVFESLIDQPHCNGKDTHFELLCRTLFRLRIWRYLARRRKNPTGSPRRLLMSDGKLASLVFGFGLSVEERETHGRTINNWLRPSMTRFRQVNDRELIRRIMRQSSMFLDQGVEDSADT